jgi:hypothetical protein
MSNENIWTDEVPWQTRFTILRELHAISYDFSNQRILKLHLYDSNYSGVKKIDTALDKNSKYFICRPNSYSSLTVLSHEIR